MGKKDDKPDTVSGFSGHMAAAMSPNSDPEKETLLEILYWIKQILGLVIGTTLGISKTQGLFGIIL